MGVRFFWARRRPVRRYAAGAVIRGTLVASAAIGAAVALAVTTSNAAPQSNLNGCSSNTAFSGELTTPSFSTAGTASPTLSFQTWWEVESNNPTSFDQMTVWASADDGQSWVQVHGLNEPLPPTEIGRSDRPFSNVALDRKPDWETVTVPLPTQFAGQPQVRLQFRFTTGDSLYNGFRGWGLDNVGVAGESVDIPLPVQTFDAGFPATWSKTGFWNVPTNPEDTQMSGDIAGPLVTLGTTDGSTPDVGLLPAGFGGSASYAWFGQPSTGTYCGTHFRLGLEASPSFLQVPVGGEAQINIHVLNNVAAGAPLIWSVSGANTVAPQMVSSPASGPVPISWTGTNAGIDELTAHIDFDGDGVPSQDELVASAVVEFVGSSPPAEQPPAEQPPAEQPPAEQPPVQQPQQPQPPRDPFPADIPTAPTVEQLPDPEPFREINVGMVGDGPVFVQLPGARGAARASQSGTPSGFIPLTQAAQVPVGSIVEATNGKVVVESAANIRGSRTQTARFDSGRFQMVQKRIRRGTPITEMVLKGGSFRGCPRTRQSASWSRTDAQDAQRRRVRRRLWGNGRGRFRTRGRYSSATVRGTRWLVEDRCDGTLTRLPARPRTSVVDVRDIGRRRTIRLRAGRSYLARPR